MPSTPRLRHLPRVALAALAIAFTAGHALAARPAVKPRPLPAPVAPTLAGEHPDATAMRAAIRAEMNRRIMAGAQRKFGVRKQHAKDVARALKQGRGVKGLRKRPTIASREGDVAGFRAPGAARPADGSLLALPANTLVNDPAGEEVGTAQSEASIAVHGSQLLAAWNDGGLHDQGWAWSDDGGATFTDGGAPPPVTDGLWVSDPVVTVDEKTGAFWYCALIDFTNGDNAVGVARATFGPSGPVWDAPSLTRVAPGAERLLDKCWVAADSASGNVYVTYTVFTALDDSILFQRSTDGGVSWDDPIVLSAPDAAGYVQNSRPVVGPGGALYAVWWETGFIEAIRCRISTDGGATFGPQTTAVEFIANPLSGAPGFNRTNGFPFPSVAVDRTTGSQRGRIHLAFNESIDWTDDVFNLGLLGPLNESEPNGTPATATPFQSGNLLRGTLNGAEVDYFRFDAVAGTTYLFYCDSIPNPLYTARVYCGSDPEISLALTGNLFGPPGGLAYFVWTAPATGPAYLRLSFVTDPASSPGGYRLWTTEVAWTGEPGLDQRDVMTVYSDDGLNWSARARAADSPPRFDDFMPEMAVGPEGLPYVMWYDYRDDACGGASHLYLSRSSDGGTSWAAGQRLTSTPSAWGVTPSNIAPNMGDYNQLVPNGGTLRAVWSDARRGDPDVFTAGVPTTFGLSACADDTTVTAGGAQVDLRVFGVNNNPLFGNDYTFTVRSERGWPMPAAGTMSAGPGGAFSGLVSVPVPDSAAAGRNLLCLDVIDAQGIQNLYCCMRVTVERTVSAEAATTGLALAPVAPNPARGSAGLSFSLPVEGEATLAVYGLRGERVRTLVSGRFGPGRHELRWDGRDDDGRPVAAGTYFVRLEALGRTARQRLVWMR
jgi:hypothetical protein